MGYMQHSIGPFCTISGQTYADALQYDPATLVTHLCAPVLPPGAVKLDHYPFFS